MWTSVKPFLGRFLPIIYLEVQMAQSFSFKAWKFININYLFPQDCYGPPYTYNSSYIFAFFMVYFYLFGHINTLCTLPHLGTLIPSNIDTNLRNYGNYVQN